MAEDKFFKYIIYSVIFTLGYYVLSVDAIRCHQCNSQKDPGCSELKLPKSIKTYDAYLKECEETHDNVTTFCRKTAYYLNYEDSYRVVRSCGWIHDVSLHHTSCINADNEGYTEVVCSCHTDGCNSAPFTLTKLSTITLSCSLILSLLKNLI